ncbi:MAG: divergent polysaccharide deacetylase family protein [Candidatus Neomarinimicrobiota bacterium]|nr:divergent polysaccharide deacetylase family protein [Candidatus Neomarinimicrobiota bacterium]
MKKSLNIQNLTIVTLIIIIIVLGASNFAALRKLDILTRSSEIKNQEKTQAVKVVDQDTLGVIVLVIDDFGYRNDNISDGFLNLGIPITCAIIPGHTASKKFAEKAVSYGKEVIIHMPMESENYSPGEDEYKLLTSMTSELLENKLIQAFESLPEAIGLNNHQGSKATSDSKTMTVLASVLKDRGKYFIDSRTSPLTIGEKTMVSFGVPTARRNIFLDNNNDIDNIEEQMNKLANSAKKNGVAVGLGHARKNTLSVIEKVVPDLLDKGFVFQFASQVVK